MTTPAYLIYGIVEATDTTPLELPASVAPVRYADLVAIIRPIVEADFASTAGANAEQPTHCLHEQQHTLYALFQQHALLPLRFGAMERSLDAVQDFLATHYLQLKTVLERVRGKAEVVLQLSWDLAAALQHICREDAELETLRQSSDPAQRVALGQRLFALAERRKRDIVQALHHALAPVVLETAEAKCTDTTMFLNGSYLILQSAENVVDTTIAAFGKSQPAFLHIKYIGPLPPYSFMPLAFERSNGALIAQARDVLGLPEQVCLRDIKAAYRRLAWHHHPDHQPDDPRAAARFAQIAEAYSTLETYCRSQVDVGDRATYSLAREHVEHVFMIRHETNRAYGGAHR